MYQRASTVTATAATSAAGSTRLSQPRARQWIAATSISSARPCTVGGSQPCSSDSCPKNCSNGRDLLLDRALREGEVAVDRSAGMTESGGPTNYPIPAPPAGRCCAAHAPGMMLANERSRRLLPTTSTLDSAMAAPASIGLSMPSAARGIAARL